MGYQSPYMRFGRTRYEKNIAKLRWHDSNIRSKTYEDAVKTLAEVLAMPDASQNYISHVTQYVTDCSHNLGPIKADDAELVARHGTEVLGPKEYDWMKDELAKKGEDVEDLSWSIK